jgi:hypothetical protein
LPEITIEWYEVVSATVEDIEHLQFHGGSGDKEDLPLSVHSSRRPHPRKYHTKVITSTLLAG